MSDFKVLIAFLSHNYLISKILQPGVTKCPNGDRQRRWWQLGTRGLLSGRKAGSNAMQMLQACACRTWLSITSQPIHVVEADGRVILEHATEAEDEVLCQIP